jgi:transcriptional/translational regulatory protein YebC/TACO1
VLESGAEDLNDEGTHWEILADPKDFEAVTNALKAAKVPTEQAEVTKIASTYTKLEGAQANAMVRLLETIEDLDDTQNVYSNFDFDEAAVAS